MWHLLLFDKGYYFFRRNMLHFNISDQIALHLTLLCFICPFWPYRAQNDPRIRSKTKAMIEGSKENESYLAL